MSTLEYEIQRGLATADDSNPVWLAVLKLLEAQIEASAEMVSSPALGGDAAHFARGDYAALRGFRRALMANRAAGKASIAG